MKYLYKLENINLSYYLKNDDIKVLRNINFEIKKNERVAIIGESGSGKTSLLMLMSGLEKPTTGRIFFDNDELSLVSEKKKTEIRKRKIGLIFQQFYLIPNYTALENVMFPMQINNIPDERKKAFSILSNVGLSKRVNNLPSELSGGEQQRLSLARALLINPSLLLLDEPTANLDPYSLNLIEEIILDENKKGKTIILTTHDMGQAKRLAKEILFFNKGKLLEQTKATNFFKKPKTKEAQSYINGKILL